MDRTKISCLVGVFLGATVIRTHDYVHLKNLLAQSQAYLNLKRTYITQSHKSEMLLLYHVQDHVQ